MSELIFLSCKSLQEKLVLCQGANVGKANARRAIKSFDQTFSKVWPPAGPPEAIRQPKVDVALAFEMTPPKERHQVDREAAGVADPKKLGKK